jgi:hypothetical protein
MFGLAGDRSEAALSILTGALSRDDPVQRRAATVAFAYFKPDPLPDLGRAAIMDAIAADDLEDIFNGLLGMSPPRSWTGTDSTQLDPGSLNGACRQHGVEPDHVPTPGARSRDGT